MRKTSNIYTLIFICISVVDDYGAVFAPMLPQYIVFYDGVILCVPWKVCV